ncbi:MAG: hypothetical protein ABJA98_07900 [Acidobacteriota bacterium]
MRTAFLASAMAIAAIAGGHAQAVATSAIPRTADGRPDLSGVWQAMNTASWNIQNHVAEKGVPAGVGVVEGNEIPYQAWALAKRAEHARHRATADPESKCYLPGVPRITYLPFPFEIAQTAKTTAIMYEYVHALRTIYTDGTPHPKGHIDWWMGDSRGRWDGDTFVVDVVDFNEETWFDRAGNFHSDELHVIERYTLLDADHIRYEVTVEDPKVFTRPWKMSMPLYRRLEKNVQVLEYECYAFDDEFHLSQ